MERIDREQLGHRVAVVLGMHRSGTSMLCRMLRTLGLELGGPLQGPAPDNPLGFWEHRFFQAVNMRLLQAAGCQRDGFDSPARLRAASAGVQQGLPKAMAGPVGELVAKSFQGGPWGFKDPRSVITYGFWQRCFAELGIVDLRPVVVVRPPVACAASLVRRGDLAGMGGAGGDGAQRAFALGLWHTYHRLLLDYDMPGAVWLLQEDLLDPSSAEPELHRLAGALGLSPAMVGPALSMVEPKLLHHRPGDAGRTGDTEVDACYAALVARVRGQQGVVAPAVEGGTAAATGTSPAPGSAQVPDCIYVVSSDGYPHSRAFDEVAATLHYAFADLGYRVPIVTQPFELGARPLVLGAQLLPEVPLPDAAIVYNLEQITPGSAWLGEDYLRVLHSHPLWDYSALNIEALRGLGIDEVQLCEVGYHASMRGAPGLPEAARDIDVFFYGSLNDRRRAALRALDEVGLRVVAGFGVYGEDRDALIRRSRVVLNMHYYESRILEVVRLTHLWTQGACVVAERGADAALEAGLQGALVFADYDGLVAACQALVADPGRRQVVAAEGLRQLRARPQVDMLRRCLGVSR